MSLSPITQRRLANFRASRRGYVSFWIFTLLFLITLPAEFLANDKPLVLSYQGHLYFPIVQFYPETAFGGGFEAAPDYKDPDFVKRVKADGWLLMPPLSYDHQTIDYSAKAAPAPPSRDHLLGVDDQGRDVLARLIYGWRISVLFALLLTLGASAIGIAAGAVQGYFGGLTDLLAQRFIEIWQGLPVLYLLIILAALVEPNFWWLLLLMLLFSWTDLVHLVRAETLRTRNFDYVRAARALGVKEPTILFRHVLPNALVATLTMLPFLLNGAITTLTSLDFLGFGLPPGSPSLGELLSQGKNNPTSPWLGLTGFTVLAVMLSLLIFIGEAARDALDPRKIFSAPAKVPDKPSPEPRALGDKP